MHPAVQDVEPSRMQMLTERELGEALDQVRHSPHGQPLQPIISLDQLLLWLDVGDTTLSFSFPPRGC